jgi:DNA-binding CsgD family transcriptional regulator
MTRRAFGLVHEAEERWRAGRDDAHQLILPVASVEAGIGLARVLRDQGRLDEALVVARETAELEARIGSAPQRWGTARAVLLSVELSRGEPGALGRLRDEARHYDPHFGIGAHQMVATWLARHDGKRRAADVVTHIEAARAASAKTRCRRCARELAVVSAELFARIGDVTEARRELQAWEADMSSPGYVMRDLWQARAHAAIAVATRAPGATERLRELAEAFEAAGFLEDAAWACVDRGRELVEAKDRREAVAAYTIAAALAERGGVLGVGRLAGRALRELGVRTWRRAPVAPGSPTRSIEALSPREREVARLVASGGSNREIADALALSPKTVERHLTNILAKVGARNRTELASHFHRAAERRTPE